MSDSGSHPSTEEERWARLTDKQRVCLDLLLERKTSKMIARDLDISKQAVDLRLTAARDILGASGRDETAIIYARLKRTYDQIPCDPIILPQPPRLVPSHFPDGRSADDPGLLASLGTDAEQSGTGPPFGNFWRRDDKPAKRMTIMAAILLFLLLIILAGLAIGQTLTRLLSN
ncbi:MAG: LuxR C-terminal-related transcriptional regulator [Sphingopyxis sp.]